MRSFLLSLFGLALLLTIASCNGDDSQSQVQSVRVYSAVGSADFFDMQMQIDSLLKRHPEWMEGASIEGTTASATDSMAKEHPFSVRLMPNLVMRDGEMFVNESARIGFARAADTAFINSLLQRDSVQALIGVPYRIQWTVRNASSDVFGLCLVIDTPVPFEASKIYVGPLLAYAGQGDLVSLQDVLAMEGVDMARYEVVAKIHLGELNATDPRLRYLLQLNTEKSVQYGSIALSTDTQLIPLGQGFTFTDLQGI